MYVNYTLNSITIQLSGTNIKRIYSIEMWLRELKVERSEVSDQRSELKISDVGVALSRSDPPKA